MQPLPRWWSAGRAAGGGRRPGDSNCTALGGRARSRRRRTARGRQLAEPDRRPVVTASQRAAAGTSSRSCEHLAAGLAEQGVVGAGGLHQRVEPRADPVQAADPHPPARLGVAQGPSAPSRRRGGTAGEQIAPVQPLEHVVLQAVRDPGARSRSAADSRRAFGQADRPAEIGDAQRQVAAEPAAQPGADGPRQRLARRAVEGARERCRPVPGLRARGHSSTSSSAAAGNLAPLLLSLDKLDRSPPRPGVADRANSIGQPAAGHRAPPRRAAGPPRPELGQLARQLGSRAIGGRWSSAAGSARPAA